MLEATILGMIPEHICISESLNLKDAVVHTHPRSKPSRAYKEIASKIVNKKYNSKKDRETIFYKIKRAFKKKKY